MSHTIDISFIIPVFNKAPVLPYVIEALSRQKGNFTAEYIFIDDASEDDSVRIIREATRNLGLKNTYIIENKKQKGLSVRLNQGITKATGDYCFFMDGGDILANDAIYYMYEQMLGTNADMAHGFFMLSDKKPQYLVDFELKSPISCFTSLHPLGTILTQKHIKRLGILAKYDTVIKAGGADASLYMDDISFVLNLAQASEKMIVFNQIIFKVSKFYPLYRTNPKNNLHILHDIFFAYYNLIQFGHLAPDEKQLTISHAMKAGAEYICATNKKCYPFMPANIYTIYYFMGHYCPALRPFILKQIAKYIQRDKIKWLPKIDMNNVKILPVLEEDAQLVRIYLDQTAKETDFMSTNENWQKDALNLVKKHLDTSLNSIFIKAVYKKEIIGLSLLKKYDITGTYQLSLSINSKFWHRGIGSLLMKTTLKIAREKGIRYIKVYVNIWDKKMLHTLRKYGFYYQDKIEKRNDSGKEYEAYLMQINL